MATTSFKEQALAILEREIDRLEIVSVETGLDENQLRMLSEMVSAYAKVAATIDARKVIMRNATKFKKTDNKTLVNSVIERIAIRNGQKARDTEQTKTDQT